MLKRSWIVMAAAIGVCSGSAIADKDLIVSHLPDIRGYETVAGISAYSLGTTACNVGTEWLAWFDNGPNGNQHPVIAQNVYRLKDGRFEQIGMSWLKHGFCGADADLCGDCDPAPSCDWLGVGCSDTYSAINNGSQFSLGPRSLVNPSTGYFPQEFPYPDGENELAGRIQIKRPDLNPILNPDAKYFGEGAYITPDDAGGLFANNNNSFREIKVGAFDGELFDLSFSGPTFVGDPAIQAWQDHTPGVVLVDVDVPGDGRFVVGGLAIDQGDGTWRYEYAIMNINSDRAASSFEIDAVGLDVIQSGFGDIDHHSGEPYDPSDWITAEAGGKLIWSAPATYVIDPNTNAVRWGTLYNYWIVSDKPPTTGSATLGLFKAGTPASMEVDGLPVPTSGPCQADYNGDESVNFFDIRAFLDDFSNKVPAADITGDRVFDFFDVQEFLDLYRAGCP